jgi:hypothetical protein
MLEPLGVLAHRSVFYLEDALMLQGSNEIKKLAPLLARA